MLNVDIIRNTKVYQEAFEEGERQNKLKTVSILLKLGLSVQQIAELVELDIEVVREVAKS